MIAFLLIVLLATPAGAPLDLAPHDSPGPHAVRPDTVGLRSIPPDSILTLPGVRVERARALSEARLRLPTAFVAELSTGASNRALETLSEVLGQAAGVHVQQYGGLGAFSTVSLRGAPPGQVSVYLDGAPLTSAAHGVVNLADLPVGAVERVEVYRGLAPLGLGVATPGGAINLVTVSSPELREAHVSRGAFDTWEARATAGLSRGALAGLLHAGYQGSDGDFRYHDDNGTPLNFADDSLSARANNRFDALTAFGSLSWQPRPALRAVLREDLFHKAQGVPGLGAVPAYHTRLAFLRSLTQLEVMSRASGWRPRLRLAGAMQRERSRFRDRTGELGLAPHDSDDRMASDDGSLGIEWPATGRWLALQAAANWRAERADLRDPADGYDDPPGSRRLTRGAMAGLGLRPLGDRLTLHAARRWDRIADHLRSVGVANLLAVTELTRELNAPQLGVSLAGPRGLELRANWARAERAPDFLELFGNQGSVLGNPSLRPERAENRDAGLSWSGAARGVRATLEWAHFESRARDLILYARNSQSNVRAQNVASARIRGEEMSVRLAPAAWAAALGSFTWQSAIEDSPTPPAWHGKRLPQRPGRQVYARLDLTRGGLRASADLQHIGDNYLDSYNTYRITSRTLVGASLSAAAVKRGVRLVVEAKNLGNNRIADVGGFPLPGRSVFVACEWRLAGAGRAQP